MEHQSTGAAECRDSGVPGQRSARVAGCRSSGAPERTSTGVLQRWSRMFAADRLPRTVYRRPFAADRFFVDRLPWAVRQQNVGTHTWDFCVSRGLLRVVTVAPQGDSENVRIRGGFLIAAGGGGARVGVETPPPWYRPIPPARRTFRSAAPVACLPRSLAPGISDTEPFR